MSTSNGVTYSSDIDEDIEVIDPARAKAIFDTTARRRAGLSGEEFLERWRNHTLPVMDHCDFMAVWVVLPLAGVDTGKERHPEPRDD